MTKLKKELNKIDTRYIIEGYEIVKCIKSAEENSWNFFTGEIKVGLNPKEKNGVLVCDKSKYVHFANVYRTVEEAEKAVIDKKIKDLRDELLAEKQYISKINKIMYIGFFTIAGLNLLDLLIKIISK